MDNENKPKIRLKPVVMTGGSTRLKTSQNTTQQMLLLKALQVTTDPKKLRDMIGVAKVADVYRTLDKMAMRKDFHQALGEAGLTFDFIVKGIKDIAVTSEKDDVRLKAFQTILKSVGMDKYDSDSISTGGSWEEVLLKKIEEEKQAEVKKIEGPKEILEYEVEIPEVPESVKKMRAEEAEVTSSIYKDIYEG